MLFVAKMSLALHRPQKYTPTIFRYTLLYAIGILENVAILY